MLNFLGCMRIILHLIPIPYTFFSLFGWEVDGQEVIEILQKAGGKEEKDTSPQNITIKAISV